MNIFVGFIYIILSITGFLFILKNKNTITNKFFLFKNYLLVILYISIGLICIILESSNLVTLGSIIPIVLIILNQIDRKGNSK